MPRNQFQRMVFAFITVVITVHAYVFYSIYVVNGDSLRQAVGTTSVLAAVRTIGGIYMFGRIMPVWSVVGVGRNSDKIYQLYKGKIQYKSSSRTGKYFPLSNLFLLIFPCGKVILLI